MRLRNSSIGGLLCILILCFFTRTAYASLPLYVEDTPISLQTPIQVVNGSILVPLSMLSEYFKAEITWIVPNQQVVVVIGGTKIEFSLGSVSARVNESTRVLDVPPELSAGHFMIPLRFIADNKGMRIQFDADIGALRILLPPHLQALFGLEVKKDDTPAVIVQDLRDIVHLGGPRSAVLLDLAAYSGYQTVLLTQPDRLVVDLQGVKGKPLPTVIFEDPLIKQVRSDWFNQTTLRIVFDLKASTGYEIHRSREGGLIVEFNYRLSDFVFFREEGSPYLEFAASKLPEFNVIHLTEPKRLVLDFQHASLMGGAQEFFPEDSRVRRVRVSQFFPSITRVVFELKDDLTPLTVLENEEYFRVLFYDGIPSEEILAKYRQQEVEVEELPEEITLQEIDYSLLDPSKLLHGRIITVDPGHGGSDPGAIGPRGTFEKDVALAISLKLGAMLLEAGAKVVYTRDDDRYISVFERPLVARDSQSEIFVSIHANSYIERTPRGTETLFHPRSRESQILARAVQNELVNTLQLIDRGLRPRSDLAVLNASRIPAIIVEVAFINNYEEELLLITPRFQEEAAHGIFKGIVQFFQELMD